MVSASQVDKLGERLRKGSVISDDALAMFEAFRQDREAALDSVVATLR